MIDPDWLQADHDRVIRENNMRAERKAILERSREHLHFPKGKPTMETPKNCTPEQAEVENLFTYLKPTDEQIPRYEAIREAGKVLAFAILGNTPKSADQSAALRKVREAVMTANASIALEKK